MIYTGVMERHLRDNEKEKETEVYLSWMSPSRLFKKRNKEFYKNVAAIIFFLAVIFIFAREYMLVLAILSILFFIYVTSTVPPEDVEHKITNLGIESAGHFYRWEELLDFWLELRWDQWMVVIRPLLGPQIVILLGDQDRETVRSLIAKQIPFRETPQKSWIDNAATWLSDKIPLEKPGT